MLLQRLVEYADRLPTPPPPLYVDLPVRYIIELDAAGRPLDPEPVDTASGVKGADQRGLRRPVPYIGRSSATRPRLYADEADYTLNYELEDKYAKRADDRHAAYRDLVARCAQHTGLPEAMAVHAFLEHDPLSKLNLTEDFDPSARITFIVNGRFPIEHPAVQAFWAAQHAPEAADDPIVMQCSLCGQHRPVRSRMTQHLKGIPGGQPTGTALVSADEPAFRSYRQTAAEGAAICDVCGERFTRAANTLLADPTSTVRTRTTITLIWTRHHQQVPFVELLNQPRPEQVKALLESPFKSTPPADLNDDAWADRFHALTLSANGGRAVIRDAIDTTITNAQQHLRRWFAWQHITSPDTSGPATPDGTAIRPYSLYALVAATVRDPRKDLHAAIHRALLNTALTSRPLPYDLLQRALHRARADPDRPLPRPRAALIKLIWCSHHPDQPENAMVQLDPDHPSTAYRSGRLLAVLEQIQRAAIPNLNTTLVTRYYGSASTSPVIVFPLLLRGAQAHMARLARDKPGLQVLFDRRLGQILGGIPTTGFPATLTLEDQALFALGFHHQRAFDQIQARQAATARAARKADAQATTDALPNIEGHDPLPPDLATDDAEPAAAQES